MCEGGSQRDQEGGRQKGGRECRERQVEFGGYLEGSVETVQWKLPGISGRDPREDC